MLRVKSNTTISSCCSFSSTDNQSQQRTCQQEATEEGVGAQEEMAMERQIHAVMEGVAQARLVPKHLLLLRCLLLLPVANARSAALQIEYQQQYDLHLLMWTNNALPHYMRGT
jgi:hypothetical protein